MGIFNSNNKISGYYQPFAGGKAAINIARASGDGNVADGAGFMVNQYSISFNRGVAILRFLNVKDNVAQVGTGTGTCTLTGLLGKVEDFKRLIVGSGNTEDICNQLIITISDASQFNKCSDGSTSAGQGSGIIKCSGGIVTGFSLGGSIDQAGILMQSGNVNITFTELTLG